MPDVTGRIGNEDVVLNNAATEATLKLLLTATLNANKQSLSAIQNLASQAGLNAQSIQNVNQSLNQTTQQSSKVGRAFEALGFVAGALSGTFKEAANLSEKLASGSGQTSDIFNSFAKIPGPVGAVAAGMSRIAQVQEAYLKTYQDLSASGANFGGSLTEMRAAISGTYLTMSEFSNVIKNNTETFARMGGTVNDGAVAFSKLSKALISSSLGSDLLALGYNFQQINEGLANYIAVSGPRTAQEMKNTKEITAASAEYLTQLDGLAQITGKTREQQAQALKEANQNQAIQSKLATMDEKQRAAYNRGLAEMEGKFGKAGRELYQAQILGIPPVTEAAKNLAALSPEVMNASQGMADVAQRGGTAAETLRYSAQATEGAVKSAERFGNVAGVMSLQGGAVGEALMNLQKEANLARSQGRETEAKDLEKRAEIIAKQKEQQESQAKAAADAQKAINELGQEILAKFLPVLQALFPVINAAVDIFTTLVTPIVKLVGVITQSETAMTALKVAVGTVIAGMVAYKAAQLAQTTVSGAANILRGGAQAGRGAIEGFKKGGIKGAIAGGLGGLATGAGAAALAGPLGSSPQNPMYVSIVSGAGGPLDQLTSKLGGQGGGIGDIVGKIGEKLGGGGGGVLDKVAGKMGGLSKVLGTAGNVLGKVALPLAAGMTAYNAFQGFTADKDASFGSKLMNAGSSALSGLTFGLLGSSPEEIAAKAKKPEAKPPAEETPVSQGERKDKLQLALENLGTEIKDLNTVMTESLKVTKEMADYTKRTMEGIKALNPNLF